MFCKKASALCITSDRSGAVFQTCFGELSNIFGGPQTVLPKSRRGTVAGMCSLMRRIRCIAPLAQNATCIANQNRATAEDKDLYMPACKQQPATWTPPTQLITLAMSRHERRKLTTFGKSESWPCPRPLAAHKPFSRLRSAATRFAMKPERRARFPDLTRKELSKSCPRSSFTGTRVAQGFSVGPQRQLENLGLMRVPTKPERGHDFDPILQIGGLRAQHQKNSFF